MAPLDVIFQIRNGFSLPFLEGVVAHSRRWRSVKLEKISVKIVQSFVEQQAPLIEDLRVVSWFTRTPSEVRIPDHMLNRLRHLKLHHVPLRWSPDALSGLLTLNLMDLGPGMISISQLIRILRKSSRIVELKIKSGTIDHSIPHDATTVELPHLIRLSLMTHPMAIQGILGSIRFPNCSNLKICASEASLDIPIFDARTAHPTATVVPMLANGRRNVAWVEEILAMLETRLVINLVVDSIGTCRPSDPPFNIASRVEELTVQGRIAKEWVDYLSQPIVVDQTASFPFARLKSLKIIDSIESGDGLLRMIRHRRFGLEDVASARGSSEDNLVHFSDGDGSMGSGATGGGGGGMTSQSTKGSTDQVGRIQSMMLQAQLPSRIWRLRIHGKNDVTKADIERLKEMVKAVHWDDPAELKGERW
ncbi:hypothetical protein FRB94_004421 [Tulasnella sp. JGI-2019a]|nr:hypothetical protein FRB94_004421 [Tulasnella sp. JGI-2019a]